MIVLCLAMGAAHAQTAAERKQEFNLEQGLALQGYDPVSYFAGKPRKGNADLTLVHQGATYLFSSRANLEVFRKTPAAYEPQYGGWCAYAMGKTGEKVPVDPETYKVKDSKLYLFYNRFFNNTLPKWNADEAALHRNADANWRKFVGAQQF